MLSTFLDALTSLACYILTSAIWSTQYFGCFSTDTLILRIFRAVKNIDAFSGISFLTFTGLVKSACNFGSSPANAIIFSIILTVQITNSYLCCIVDTLIIHTNILILTTKASSIEILKTDLSLLDRSYIICLIDTNINSKCRNFQRISTETIRITCFLAKR